MSGNFHIAFWVRRFSRRLCTRLLPMALAIGAVLLTLTPAWAQGVSPSEATAAQNKAAEKPFKAASKLYDKGEFDKAIELFRESFEIVASPNTALMIARSYRDAGQLSKAVEEFKHAVEVAESAA